VIFEVVVDNVALLVEVLVSVVVNNTWILDFETPFSKKLLLTKLFDVVISSKFFEKICDVENGKEFW
jgi:hypothetical protein